MTIQGPGTGLPRSLTSALDYRPGLPAEITDALHHRPGLLLRLWLALRGRGPRRQPFGDLPPHLRRDIGLPDGEVPVDWRGVPYNPLDITARYGWRR